jgi:hypothetical protein
MKSVSHSASAWLTGAPAAAIEALASAQTLAPGSNFSEGAQASADSVISKIRRSA